MKGYKSMCQNYDASLDTSLENPDVDSQLPPMSEADKAAICAAVDAAFGVRRESNPAPVDVVDLGAALKPGIDAWLRTLGKDVTENPKSL